MGLTDPDLSPGAPPVAQDPIATPGDHQPCGSRAGLQLPTALPSRRRQQDSKGLLVEARLKVLFFLVPQQIFSCAGTNAVS